MITYACRANGDNYQQEVEIAKPICEAMDLLSSKMPEVTNDFAHGKLWSARKYLKANHINIRSYINGTLVREKSHGTQLKYRVQLGRVIRQQIFG